MKQFTETSAPSLLAGEAGYDPIEDRLRENIRAMIEAMFEEELAAFLGRCRYGRGGEAKKGYRHGHRERQLIGTFGMETVKVPRVIGAAEYPGAGRCWRCISPPPSRRHRRR